MQRESLVSISVRAADPAWLCIFHLSLCITKSIKTDLGNKETDQFLERLASPMSSFLSYSIFWLILIWSIEAHRVYLFAWASKTLARGSPRQGTLRYSSRRQWPYVDGVSLLSEALLAFYVNQGIQPLSLLYSLNCKLFPYLSLNIYISLTTPSPLRITLDPPGLVPGNQASIFPPTLIKP